MLTLTKVVRDYGDVIFESYNSATDILRLVVVREDDLNRCLFDGDRTLPATCEEEDCLHVDSVECLFEGGVLHTPVGAIDVAASIIGAGA